MFRGRRASLFCRINFLILVLLLVGCDTNNDVDSLNNTRENNTYIRIGGSTTLYPLFEDITTSYMKTHPEIIIKNTASSSGKGIAKLIDGDVSIARSSRNLLPLDLMLAKTNNIELKKINIGRDTVSIIVNNYIGKTLNGLTIDQLRAIFFHGTIKKWSDIDASLPDNLINVYARDASDSGTSYTFKKKVISAASIPFISNAFMLNSTPNLLDAIVRDKNGIAFLPTLMTNNSITELKIKSNSGPYETPSSSSYAISRNLYLFVTTPMKKSIANFISYVNDSSRNNVFKKNMINR